MNATKTDLFRYVDDPHGYFVGDVELPSPSVVFQDLGLVDKRWFTDGSRTRGRAVHAGLHYALKGTLDWGSLHPDLHGYVKSGLRLFDRLGPRVVRFETPMHHPTMRFAGTSDLEVEYKGCGEIWDWKSGKAPAVSRYQTAAYVMLACQGNGKRFRRAAIELQEDGSIANRVPHEDHTDGAGWLNLLGAYRVRQALRQSRDLAPIEIGEQTP